MKKTRCDVVVVGGGPNGLTAAAVLGLAGLSVVVLERHERIGGGCRTEPLTLPGFLHDVCGAIHPVGAVSPVFERLGLTSRGLEWVPAPLPLAHPLDNGDVAVLSRDLVETADSVGRDGEAWTRMVAPFVERHRAFFNDVLRPVRFPRHPLLMARFASIGLQSCTRLAGRFEGTAARALLAGNAAHSFLPLEAAGSASFGLVLAIAGHAVDWPCARGGSERIIDALASVVRDTGGDVHTGVEVRTLADVPDAGAVLFDLTPRQLDAVAGDALSAGYRRQLRRFAYGAAAFKVDYALSSPIPWRASRCHDAATVHVGGSFEDIARSEADANAGRINDAPFVLVAQQSHVDPSRAPEGRHTGWAYCHVPHGADADMTERIERQIERFAPGFRDTILERHVKPPRTLEAHNPNLVGGDIAGGANTLRQVIFRPMPRWNPYATSNPRLFICSSSTPPGAGVHGMCGYWAARTVLRRVFRREVPRALDL
jgi:phytoene dehydrogenase-like protein